MTAKPKKALVIAKNSTAVVARTFKFDSAESDNPGELKDSHDEELVSIHKFVTTPAEVGVEISLTMNIGNFESAKISVSLRLPCYAEEKDEACDYVQKWVEDRITKERQLIKRHLSGDVNPL